MADERKTEGLDRPTAVSADAEAARSVTTRRRLMLGAAAVVPSIVTLPAGAQRAVQSFTCNRQDRGLFDPSGVPRFTEIPDEWLRKRIFSGRLASNGRAAYCTTWDQPNIMAIAKLENAASGYRAVNGTMWSDGSLSFKSGDGCNNTAMTQVMPPGSTYCYAETVDNISPEPDKYGLVYVDDTGLNCSLEPGPGMAPVRATCWASLAGARGTNLG